MSALHIIVLAAGKGTRMNSDKPKVLMPLAGRGLLDHVLDTCRELNPAKIHVVYGFRGDDVKAACDAPDIDWVEQKEQLGTGHAVNQALPHIDDSQTVLIVYGDMPMVSSRNLNLLFAPLKATGGLSIATTIVDDPTGYGRIVRGADGLVKRSVEQRDAVGDVELIKEINPCIYASTARNFKKWLESINNLNAQSQYYLTDIIEMAVADGQPIHDHQIPAEEAMGINTARQLADCEAVMRKRLTNQLLEQGVRMADPSRVDIRGDVTCGKDVFIDVNCLLEGDVVLGDSVEIGPNCVISNTTVGMNTHIKAGSVIDGATIGDLCELGPSCRIRPDTTLADGVKIGNFVELKNSQLGIGAKAGHLAYLGDAIIGKRVNIGAGVVTCNYDGATKHKTEISDGAFIGSGTQLVAPVSVGENAYIGAGSVITEDAPADQLTLSRSEQHSKSRPLPPKKLA